MADLAIGRSFAMLLTEAQAITNFGRVFGGGDETTPDGSTPAQTASGATAPAVSAGALGDTEATPVPEPGFDGASAGPMPQSAQSLAGLRLPFSGGFESAASTPLDAEGTASTTPAGDPAGRAPALVTALPGTLPAGVPEDDAALPLPSDAVPIGDDVAVFDGDRSTLSGAVAPGDTSPALPLADAPDLIEGPVDPAKLGDNDATASATGRDAMRTTAEVAAATMAERQGTDVEPSRHNVGRETGPSESKDTVADRLASHDRDVLSLHDTALLADIAVARRDAASNIEVWTADILQALANGDTQVETGIIPSFILNAAMIPGWPPPRPFEMPSADRLLQLLAKGGPQSEEALLRTLAERGGASLMTRLRSMLDRLSRSKRLRLLLGLTALMTTIEAAIEAIEAELLQLAGCRANPDDIAFEDASHRRYLSA